MPRKTTLTRRKTMSHEYLFDLILSCSMRVRADSVEEGKRKLAELFNCADANFGMLDDQPATAEVSLDYNPYEGQEPIDAIKLAAVDDEPADEKERKFLNYYKCPKCGFEWPDVWTAMCDDDCLNCGCRHVQPYKSEDL
jgi:hypothetical protein